MMKNAHGGQSFAKWAFAFGLVVVAYLMVGDAHGFLAISDHVDNIAFSMFGALAAVWGTDKIANGRK